MTENVGDAANVLMQMGMAKAGQVGRPCRRIGDPRRGRRRALCGRHGRARRRHRALGAGLGRPRRAGVAGRGVARCTRFAGGHRSGRAGAAGRGGTRCTCAAGCRGARRAICRWPARRGATSATRGGGAVLRGARALPGAVVRGVRALPGAVARGARALPGAAQDLRTLPGRLAGDARQYVREFAVGEGINGVGSARTAAAEVRAGVWAEARAPGGALARDAAVAADEAAELPPPARTEAPASEGAAPTSGPTPDPTPAPTRAGDQIELTDAMPESAVAREASVAESGSLPNERMGAQRIRNEVDELNAHPERVEGTPPNRRAEMGEHQWREAGPVFCRFSPTRICVDTTELRGAHVARAEARAAEAQADALASSERAALARQRASASTPLTAPKRRRCRPTSPTPRRASPPRGAIWPTPGAG